jgi:hypothetical protein
MLVLKIVITSYLLFNDTLSFEMRLPLIWHPNLIEFLSKKLELEQKNL